MSKVNILMAIYKPNKKWLAEQLASLNNQTYSNIELLVWNDCPEDKTDYEKIFSYYIKRFPFRIYRGKVNAGSNKAFENLTALANSDYVAYCDQDDVWLPNKIDILVQVAKKTEAKLLCSDMHIIDADSQKVSDSITKVRAHHVFFEGSSQFEYLCSRNFVVGCTTLVKTDFAKHCLPFPKEFIHDWWLAINASYINSLIVIKESLINYRIHGNNQTGILSGVNNKKDYLKCRIEPVIARSYVLLNHFAHSGKEEFLQRFRDCAEVRKQYFFHHGVDSLLKMIKYLNINRSTIIFEIFLPIIPEFVFVYIINQIKKGKM